MAGAGVEKEKSEAEVVSVELPAPEGWVKKFTPKQGSAPRRNEVVFISPTGEEIKNRRQLDQYLRSNPGGPTSSSFDWGTGDTPRRSARISEKVKVSPESEKPMRAARSAEKLEMTPKDETPKRASRSSERVKTAPEVEKKKQASSSGLRKGTKRKKNTKNIEDEAEPEADESGGPKDGDVEDDEGSKKPKKRRATEVGGHKAEGEGDSAGEDVPKYVDMDSTEGTDHTKSEVATAIEETHGSVDHASTELTKGNVEKSMEPALGSQAEVEHRLADNAEGNVNEKVEKDVEQSEGRTAPESDKKFEGTLNGTGLPLTPPDSEKVALIEKKDSPKDDEDMEEAEEASNKEIPALLEDKLKNKSKESIHEYVEQPAEIQGEIKHDVADKAREGDNIEEPKGTEHDKSNEAASREGRYSLVEHASADKADEAPTVEGVYGSAGLESTAETRESAVENVEQTAEGQNAIEHESVVIMEETVEETVTLHVEIQDEVEHGGADKAKENNDVEEAEGTEQSKFKEAANSEGFYSLHETESVVKTTIKHELAGITIENVKKNVEQHVESQIAIKHELATKANENGLEKTQKEIELEPDQGVEDDSVISEVCPPVSDEVALTQKGHEPSPAEILSGSGGKMDEEMTDTGKDNFEQLKEIVENPIVAESFQSAPVSEKDGLIDVSASVSKNDAPSSAGFIKEAATTSENGGKEEAVDSLDDFLHDYDDENMQMEAPPPNW